METWITIKLKKLGIGEHVSIKSDSLRSWTQMSKANQWITVGYSSPIVKQCGLPPILRLRGDWWWHKVVIEFWNHWLNTMISTMTAVCCQLSWQGINLRTVQGSIRYGIATSHTSASSHWRECKWWITHWKWLQVQCIGYIKYNIDRIPLYPITSNPTEQQKLVYPCIPWLPIELSNRSWYTWIYVVLWKHMSEDVDMHDTSSTTPWGIRICI